MYILTFSYVLTQRGDLFNLFDFVCIQHWIANNLFGLAFAVNGVEFLSLNSISTGCILLGGLFVYDVFWVFGTNVMVTVAKSFEAPIKCKLSSLTDFIEHLCFFALLTVVLILSIF